MISEEDLTARVEEMRRNLQQASDDVSTWSSVKRQDAEATMYAPSLSTFYESLIKEH
jgi:hypothetical protein